MAPLNEGKCGRAPGVTSKTPSEYISKMPGLFRNSQGAPMFVNEIGDLRPWFQALTHHRLAASSKSLDDHRQSLVRGFLVVRER